jgi:hypothetical protein
VRRFRRKLPRARIMVGLWTLTAEESARRDALTETAADLVVTSLQEAMAAILAAARGDGAPAAHDAAAQRQPAAQ